MPTIVEKIIAAHAGRPVRAGEIAELSVDARLARDFGGANVVKNLEAHGLGVVDSRRTFFTFDCNPTGSDQSYAANQQRCRVFARGQGVRIYDIDAGIGTHLAIDEGLVGPGETLVSTDSHANIVGAIGALGQGMGDLDIAAAFAYGKVWFEVPATVKVVLRGRPGPLATPKDIGLALLRRFGANGLLGKAAELYGEAVESLTLDGRITVSSLATEMGAISLLVPPDAKVLEHCAARAGRRFAPVAADPDAAYEEVVEIDVDGLGPLVSRPGHPEDVVPLEEVAGKKIDSAFLGSCTNGRMEDLLAAAKVLEGRRVAPGVVFKVVPATDALWRRALETGLLAAFKKAGALVGNAGCAGCAAGQIGQNGPGEVTVSTGNRNFAGKQGKGAVYLASPATVAACAIAGVITSADRIPEKSALFAAPAPKPAAKPAATAPAQERPLVLTGRVWIVDRDNVDTDMIYHNRHLAVTDIREMGRHAFGNLPGWEDFPKKAKAGDIVVTGKNFGAGSSRQQAVDCFKSLGVALIVARSFGAIYYRNAVNAAMPVMVGDLVQSGLRDGDEIRVDLVRGTVEVLATGRKIQAQGFPQVQLEIYRRGDLLAPGR
jgi:3-isopropylmalate dehydratase small subunit